MGNRKRMFILLLIFGLTGTIITLISIAKNCQCQMQATSPYTSSLYNRIIHFMETSGSPRLNARQACAIESAAKTNPEMLVDVHLLSPALYFNSSHIAELSKLSNVRFSFLDLNSYFVDTPLQSWYLKGDWKKSPYKVSHMSDALRFLTLWKYGGIYLDLDVVVLRNLDELKNCAGLQSRDILAPGVMAFNKGHQFLFKCLKEFSATYKGDWWDFNGPLLITRMLQRECTRVRRVVYATRDKCNGIAAMPVSAFYAIGFRDWQKFFDAKNAENVMEMWRNSYLIHTWNKNSVKTPIKIGSGQPYEIVAKKHCPAVYNLNAVNGFF